jgi:F0F1-type ATP synthase alpha subunit
VGDRGTGKRRAALDLLSAQRQLAASPPPGLVHADRCVYVSVGQPPSATERVQQELLQQQSTVPPP